MITTEKTETAIRERAYQIWEKAGRPEGQAETHWFEALDEITAAPAMTTPEPTAMQKPKTRAKKAAVTTAKKAAQASKKASAAVAKRAPAAKAKGASKPAVEK